MRKNRQHACHYRYVLPGTGRNASLSSRSHCAKFLLTHLSAHNSSPNSWRSSESPIQKLSRAIAGTLTRCSLSSADRNDALHFKPFANFSLRMLEEKRVVFIFAASKEYFQKRDGIFATVTKHPELKVALTKEFRLEAIEFTSCTKLSPNKLLVAKGSSRRRNVSANRGWGMV